MSFTSNSEYQHNHIQITNELPPYDFYEGVHSLLTDEIWKWLLGYSEVEFDTDDKLFSQDPESYTSKFTNGVESETFGPSNIVVRADTIKYYANDKHSFVELNTPFLMDTYTTGAIETTLALLDETDIKSFIDSLLNNSNVASKVVRGLEDLLNQQNKGDYLNTVYYLKIAENKYQQFIYYHSNQYSKTFLVSTGNIIESKAYHRMSVNGVLLPEEDLFLHEIYRYLETLYPDNPEWTKLLTTSEFNDAIINAAALVDYKPNTKFFDFLASQLTDDPDEAKVEAAKIKIRNLTNNSYRRKLYGSYYGYRMFGNDIFYNTVIYPVGVYLPLSPVDLRMNAWDRETKSWKVYTKYNYDTIDLINVDISYPVQSTKNRFIDQFDRNYQNRFRVIDWEGTTFSPDNSKESSLVKIVCSISFTSDLDGKRYITFDSPLAQEYARTLTVGDTITGPGLTYEVDDEIYITEILPNQVKVNKDLAEEGTFILYFNCKNNLINQRIVEGEENFEKKLLNNNLYKNYNPYDNGLNDFDTYDSKFYKVDLSNCIVTGISDMSFFKIDSTPDIFYHEVVPFYYREKYNVIGTHTIDISTGTSSVFNDIRDISKSNLRNTLLSIKARVTFTSPTEAKFKTYLSSLLGVSSSSLTPYINAFYQEGFTIGEHSYLTYTFNYDNSNISSTEKQKVASALESNFTSILFYVYNNGDFVPINCLRDNDYNAIISDEASAVTTLNNVTSRALYDNDRSARSIVVYAGLDTDVTMNSGSLDTVRSLLTASLTQSEYKIFGYGDIEKYTVAYSYSAGKEYFVKSNTGSYATYSDNYIDKNNYSDVWNKNLSYNLLTAPFDYIEGFNNNLYNIVQFNIDTVSTQNYSKYYIYDVDNAAYLPLSAYDNISEIIESYKEAGNKFLYNFVESSYIMFSKGLSEDSIYAIKSATPVEVLVENFPTKLYIYKKILFKSNSDINDHIIRSEEILLSLIERNEHAFYIADNVSSTMVMNRVKSSILSEYSYNNKSQLLYVKTSQKGYIEFADISEYSPKFKYYYVEKDKTADKDVYTNLLTPSTIKFNNDIFVDVTLNHTQTIIDDRLLHVEVLDYISDNLVSLSRASDSVNIGAHLILNAIAETDKNVYDISTKSKTYTKNWNNSMSSVHDFQGRMIDKNSISVNLLGRGAQPVEAVKDNNAERIIVRNGLDKTTICTIDVISWAQLYDGKFVVTLDLQDLTNAIVLEHKTNDITDASAKSSSTKLSNLGLKIEVNRQNLEVIGSNRLSIEFGVTNAKTINIIDLEKSSTPYYAIIGSGSNPNSNDDTDIIDIVNGVAFTPLGEYSIKVSDSKIEAIQMSFYKQSFKNIIHYYNNDEIKVVSDQLDNNDIVLNEHEYNDTTTGADIVKYDNNFSWRESVLNNINYDSSVKSFCYDKSDTYIKDSKELNTTYNYSSVSTLNQMSNLLTNCLLSPLGTSVGSYTYKYIGDWDLTIKDQTLSLPSREECLAMKHDYANDIIDYYIIKSNVDLTGALINLDAYPLDFLPDYIVNHTNGNKFATCSIRVTGPAILMYQPSINKNIEGFLTIKSLENNIALDQAKNAGTENSDQATISRFISSVFEKTLTTGKTQYVEKGDYSVSHLRSGSYNDYCFIIDSTKKNNGSYTYLYHDGAHLVVTACKYFDPRMQGEIYFIDRIIVLDHNWNFYSRVLTPGKNNVPDIIRGDDESQESAIKGPFLSGLYIRKYNNIYSPITPFSQLRTDEPSFFSVSMFNKKRISDYESSFPLSKYLSNGTGKTLTADLFMSSSTDKLYFARPDSTSSSVKTMYYRGNPKLFTANLVATPIIHNFYHELNNTNINNSVLNQPVYSKLRKVDITSEAGFLTFIYDTSISKYKLDPNNGLVELNTLDGQIEEFDEFMTYLSFSEDNSIAFVDFIDDTIKNTKVYSSFYKVYELDVNSSSKVRDTRLYTVSSDDFLSFTSAKVFNLYNGIFTTFYSEGKGFINRDFGIYGAVVPYININSDTGDYYVLYDIVELDSNKLLTQQIKFYNNETNPYYDTMIGQYETILSLPRRYIAEGSYKFDFIINPKFYAATYEYNMYKQYLLGNSVYDIDTLPTVDKSVTDSAIYYDEDLDVFYIKEQYINNNYRSSIDTYLIGGVDGIRPGELSNDTSFQVGEASEISPQRFKTIAIDAESDALYFDRDESIYYVGDGQLANSKVNSYFKVQNGIFSDSDFENLDGTPKLISLNLEKASIVSGTVDTLYIPLAGSEFTDKIDEDSNTVKENRYVIKFNENTFYKNVKYITCRYQLVNSQRISSGSITATPTLVQLTGLPFDADNLTVDDRIIKISSVSLRSKPNRLLDATLFNNSYTLKGRLSGIYTDSTGGKLTISYNINNINWPNGHVELENDYYTASARSVFKSDLKRMLPVGAGETIDVLTSGLMPIMTDVTVYETPIAEDIDNTFKYFKNLLVAEVTINPSTPNIISFTDASQSAVSKISAGDTIVAISPLDSVTSKSSKIIKILNKNNIANGARASTAAHFSSNIVVSCTTASVYVAVGSLDGTQIEAVIRKSLGNDRVIKIEKIDDTYYFVILSNNSTTIKTVKESSINTSFNFGTLSTAASQGRGFPVNVLHTYSENSKVTGGTQSVVMVGSYQTFNSSDVLVSAVAKTGYSSADMLDTEAFIYHDELESDSSIIGKTNAFVAANNRGYGAKIFGDVLYIKSPTALADDTGAYTGDISYTKHWKKALLPLQFRLKESALFSLSGPYLYETLSSIISNALHRLASSSNANHTNYRARLINVLSQLGIVSGNTFTATPVSGSVVLEGFEFTDDKVKFGAAYSSEYKSYRSAITLFATVAFGLTESYSLFRDTSIRDIYFKGNDLYIQTTKGNIFYISADNMTKVSDIEDPDSWVPLQYDSSLTLVSRGVNNSNASINVLVQEASGNNEYQINVENGVTVLNLFSPVAKHEDVLVGFLQPPASVYQAYTRLTGTPDTPDVNSLIERLKVIYKIDNLSASNISSYTQKRPAAVCLTSTGVYELIDFTWDTSVSAVFSSILLVDTELCCFTSESNSTKVLKLLKSINGYDGIWSEVSRTAADCNILRNINSANTMHRSYYADSQINTDIYGNTTSVSLASTSGIVVESGNPLSYRSGMLITGINHSGYNSVTVGGNVVDQGDVQTFRALVAIRTTRQIQNPTEFLSYDNADIYMSQGDFPVPYIEEVDNMAYADLMYNPAEIKIETLGYDSYGNSLVSNNVCYPSTVDDTNHLYYDWVELSSTDYIVNNLTNRDGNTVFLCNQFGESYFQYLDNLQPINRFCDLQNMLDLRLDSTLCVAAPKPKFRSLIDAFSGGVKFVNTEITNLINNNISKIAVSNFSLDSINPFIEFAANIDFNDDIKRLADSHALQIDATFTIPYECPAKLLNVPNSLFHYTVDKKQNTFYYQNISYYPCLNVADDIENDTEAYLVYNNGNYGVRSDFVNITAEAVTDPNTVKLENKYYLISKDDSPMAFKYKRVRDLNYIKSLIDYAYLRVLEFGKVPEGLGPDQLNSFVITNNSPLFFRSSTSNGIVYSETSIRALNNTYYYIKNNANGLGINAIKSLSVSGFNTNSLYKYNNHEYTQITGYSLQDAYNYYVENSPYAISINKNLVKDTQVYYNANDSILYPVYRQSLEYVGETTYDPEKIYYSKSENEDGTVNYTLAGDIDEDDFIHKTYMLDDIGNKPVTSIYIPPQGYGGTRTHTSLWNGDELPWTIDPDAFTSELLYNTKLEPIYLCDKDGKFILRSAEQENSYIQMRVPKYSGLSQLVYYEDYEIENSIYSNGSYGDIKYSPVSISDISRIGTNMIILNDPLPNLSYKENNTTVELDINDYKPHLIKLALITRVPVSLPAKYMNNKKYFIRMEEKDIKTFGYDRVYWNPDGYPCSPVTIGNDIFFADHNVDYYDTDYTSEYGNAIYACNEEGYYIKYEKELVEYEELGVKKSKYVLKDPIVLGYDTETKKVKGDLSDYVTASFDQRFRPQQPKYNTCQDWYKGIFHVSGQEKNPYWQVVQIASEFDKQTQTFESEINIFDYQKRNSVMGTHVADKSTSYFNLLSTSAVIDNNIIENDIVNSADGELRFILTLNEDNMYCQNGRFDPLSADRSFVKYGISVYNPNRFPIDSAHKRLYNMFNIEGITDKQGISAFLQASYDTNTYENYVDKSDTDHAIVAVNELGIYDKNGRLLIYSKFPAIEYRSDTQHLDFTVVLGDAPIA